jgi:hypothetical protein
LVLGKPGGFLYCKVGGCTTVNWNQNISIHCYPRKHHSLARPATASGPVNADIHMCSNGLEIGPARPDPPLVNS